MGKKLKDRVLESIGEIYKEAKGCKLENSFFEKHNNLLLFLSIYFKQSKQQSFFVAIIFFLNYKGDSVSINDLMEYFECNPVCLFFIKKIFEEMSLNNILVVNGFGVIRTRIETAKMKFHINLKIFNAIIDEKPIPAIENDNFKDVVEVLEELSNFRIQCSEHIITTSELFYQTKRLISLNLHFPLIKRINNLNYSIQDTYFFLYLIWETIIGNEYINIGRETGYIFDKATERVQYMQQFFSDKNPLLKNDWAELVEGNFLNDTEIKLTNASLDMINESGIKLFSSRKRKDNLIDPKKIIKRKLFFKSEEMKQLSMLEKLLQTSNLTKTQEMLINKGLPKGITILLYGEPGTGKTESVLQLAKDTNREIMKVDISQSKSKWFGESEKIIKRIFTDYKTTAKDCERMPILFFNEADAIFSKRREVGDSNIAQTENAIQNIILEELENFEGILIATTNLTKNFDSAFDRRFLFKIKFQKPDTDIKTKIWKLKLPGLNLQTYKMLASQFDLSGGQIDNVARKCHIYEVVNSKKVSQTMLLEFCEEEVLNKANRQVIGFNMKIS